MDLELDRVDRDGRVETLCHPVKDDVLVIFLNHHAGSVSRQSATANLPQAVVRCQVPARTRMDPALSLFAQAIHTLSKARQRRQGPLATGAVGSEARPAFP
jgi:hypothetical protein